ncbi:MAG: spore cortex biosynthesis protein YabQ [Lachnospira sp.]
MSKYQISQEIIDEAAFFSMSVWWGMVIAFAYDGIRIFRRVIIHRHIIWVWIEDIIFWCVTGLSIFSLCFDRNDGILRLFCVVGLVIGASVYGGTISRYYVRSVSKILLILLKPLKNLIIAVKIKAETIVKSLFKRRRPNETGNKQTEKAESHKT